MATKVPDLGGPLRYRTEPRNGTTWIALSGHVNEATDFTPLRKLPGPLVIDLGEIENINSLGVREWIFFVRECETSGVELTFERCSPLIVNQMSMISNFMGSRSRVKSVLIPYVCLSCNHELDVLLELSAGAEIHPTMPCPKCGATMQLDDLVEMYTQLVQTQGMPRVQQRRGGR
jgi:hypothetical protein